MGYINAVQKILNESNRKPNEIQVVKGREFYNRSMKSTMVQKFIQRIMNENLLLLKDILELQKKNYKQISSISKNGYIDKLDNTGNKYNNEYHSTIKMKPIDVQSNTYIESSKEINNKDPKFKTGDFVRISKYKIIFEKGYTPNWSEEVFVIKKV